MNRRTRKGKQSNYESEDDDNDVVEDVQEFYDWQIIPNCNSEDRKTGVTFKGDNEDYFKAKDWIKRLLSEKGSILSINERKIRIVDNPKNKPIKIEVKPPQKPAGKVNITIFDVNKSGSATMMITKTKDAELIHVKTLAFRVIKYLLDGIIDGEIKEDDLNSYKEDVRKTEKGQIKDDQLYCHVCEKGLKTKTGLNIHKRRVHGDIKDSNKCEKCNFIFQENSYLEHLKNCSKSSQEDNPPIITDRISCEYCDLIIIAENEMKTHHELEEHHKICNAFPNKPSNSPNIFECENCVFSTKQENLFKRHIRDKHDILTASTSPKPKKRKNEELSEESMEVDINNEDDKEEETKDEIKEMEIDADDAILLKRSRMWDEKIRQKQVKEEEKEREQIKKQKKEKEEKQAEKVNNKKLKKKKKVARNKVKDEKLKPFLKELPIGVKNLIGSEYCIYKIEGDGACGLRSAATWLFQDQTLGPYLGRNLNNHFVQNWEYWKTFISFPFEREVGIGKKKKFESENELFDFFLNSKDGAFMWRDHEDFAALANIYQFKIKIITVMHLDDPQPRVSMIEPDPGFSCVKNSPTGAIPEMVLFHQNNVHYDLVVQKASKLAIEGGLDYQRQHKSNKSVENEEDNEKQDKNAMEDKAELKEKVAILEVKLHALQEKLVKLEAEKEAILKERNQLETENEYICCGCSEKFQSKSSVRAHMKYNIKGDKIVCELCDSTFISVASLEEHMKTHNQNKCTYCRTTFWTDFQLKTHIEDHHVNQSFKCIKCHSLFESEDSYKKHSVTHDGDGHKCEFCTLEFKTKCEIESHLQKQHIMRNYFCEDCKLEFSSNYALDSHLKTHKKKTCDCQQCGEKFIEEEDLEKHMADHHSENEFECDVCSKKFSSKSSVETHKETHKVSNKKCQLCDKEFKLQIQLENHMSEVHSQNQSNTTAQYNCKDCAFQGDSWSSLKKHIQSLRHNPSDFSEKCFTCKIEFNSYWTLMNHRREEHPSKKICRYYLKQECLFSSKKCWYKHEEKNSEDPKEETPQFNCKICGQIFSWKGDLMMHKKKEHRETVAKCRRFLQGDCSSSAEACWYIHEMNEIMNKDKNQDPVEDMELGQSQGIQPDFHEVKERAPPDQLKMIMEMLTNLSVQVTEIKRVQKIQERRI